MIPYGRQSISKDDLAAVVDVLTSDFLTQGPAVPAFEETMRDLCDAKHSIAVSNATAALHIACLALGVGRGDIVWTSPITFVASANCALYCGAEVDFVDIDPRTYNLSLEALADKLKRAELTGRLPKVVIPVHLAGQSCDMAGLNALALRYGFKVVEDASHAVGAHYKGEPVGNCRYSDITIFSFHPVKIITTAEGGLALTNSPELAQRMSLLRSHGITRDPEEMTGPSEGAWFYEQLMLGFNYRMTDIQAALGSSQALRLHEFVGRRRELAAMYDASLTGLPLTLPWQHPDTTSSYHLYIIQLEAHLCEDRARVFDELRNQGIGANLHYIPVYLQPYYRRLGFQRGYCPEAEKYYSCAISIPLYPGMSQQDQAVVIDALKKAVPRG